MNGFRSTSVLNQGELYTAASNKFSPCLSFWIWHPFQQCKAAVLVETYVQRRDKTERDQFHAVVLHDETLVFINTAIVVTIAEVENGSTFR